MKDISLRPKKQLMGLFKAVQELDNLPNINRNAIVDRALGIALKYSHVNWQSVSEVLIQEQFDDQIPTHIVLKVDEEKFSQVNRQIRGAFHVDKITIPYTLRLLLTLYFVHLKRQADHARQSDEVSEMLVPDVQIDTLALKHEYEQSLYSGKKRLFELCRVFLKYYPEVNEQLNSQCEQRLSDYVDFIDLNKYFATQIKGNSRSSTYVAKVLAGMFILRVESALEPMESKNMLDQVVKQLEAEFQTVGDVINHADSAAYFRDVYAKMMGGKI